MDINIIFRMESLAVLISTMAISSAFRKRARDEGGVIPRKAEGTLVLWLRMLVGLPLFAAILVYIARPAWLAWSFLTLPDGLRWLFGGLMLCCVPLMWWVFRSIGKNVSETILTKEGHELVTSGPYRWIRHPLYATALLMILCLGVLSTSWVLLAYAVSGILVFRLIVIPREEKNLQLVFGDRYATYRKTSGALFPRIF